MSIVIREFQEALLSQIQRESDFAISLHMTVVLLFPMAFPGSLIHISGRFVPMILKSLESFLAHRKVEANLDLFEFLQTYQQRIIADLKARDGAALAILDQDLKTLKATLAGMLK
jgi:hypothetical protein